MRRMPMNNMRMEKHVTSYIALLTVIYSISMYRTVAFTCKYNTKQGLTVKCVQWYGYVRSEITCQQSKEELILECDVKYGCTQGVVTAELQLCRSTPSLSLHVDLADMEVFDQVPSFSFPLYKKMGVVDVEVRGTGVVGEGYVLVRVGEQVLYKGLIKDRQCQQQFKKLMKYELLEILGVGGVIRESEYDLKCLKPVCG